jgi:hypothetical protein
MQQGMQQLAMSYDHILFDFVIKHHKWQAMLTYILLLQVGTSVFGLGLLPVFIMSNIEC